MSAVKIQWIDSSQHLWLAAPLLLLPAHRRHNHIRHRVADDIQPRAAVFLRIGDAHPAVLPKLSNDLIRKGVRLIKLKRNRLDFRFRESTDLLPRVPVWFEITCLIPPLPKIIV